MPLLGTEEHKRYHSLGPKDLKWPFNFFKKERPINVIHIQKEVSTGEHMSVDVPVFRDDSRDDIKTRVGVFQSMLQDRMDEFAQAWNEAQKRAEEHHKLAAVTKIKE